ncbi:hypothetical protein [Cereibacter sediminicola]|uniref:hypothetical protein n=1 Tax=Cereibacter sediminicola TaxID=2584941 RepID=UPI0011A74800|nr:hypothetical protein [Cereibacter sediminicola]
MAIKVTTTPPGETEPPARFTHTPISRCFSRLLGTLGCCVEAERDIAHANWADPAFADWLTEAERTRVTTLAGMAEVLNLQIERISDLPLRLTALLGQAMLRSTHPNEFTQLYGLLDRHADCFCCPGSDPTSRRVDRMLSTAKARLHVLAALSAGPDTSSDPEVSPGGC